MSQYASQTKVSPARSRAEIEEILGRYGCEGFLSGSTADHGMIAFQIGRRQVKFLLPLPDPNADEFKYTPTQRQRRSQEAQKAAYEQAVRQRWRALALAIKAKLEAVECGIVTFDQEFLAHIVGIDGRTVGETVIPQIENGELPRLSMTQP